LRRRSILTFVLCALALAACTEVSGGSTQDTAVSDTAAQDTAAQDTAAQDTAAVDAAADTSVTDTASVDDAAQVDGASPADVSSVDTSSDATTVDASPVDAGSVDGGGENPCAADVLCKALPPECAAPLVPVALDDCWGCGYPETCSCDDGKPALCDMVPPECGPDTILATQGGCYSCVNPFTCAPLKPPSDTCGSDDECVLTAYDTLVESVDDCFCPMCPNWSVSKAEHQARKDAWNQVCADWEKENPCPSPKCAAPGDPICVQGQCEIAPSSCEEGITCFGLPLDCKAPFVSVAKDQCWACGYPETCSCSIAETPTCKMMTPNCPPGSELAVQGDANFSCWACVDPYTCLEVKDPGPECNEKGECTLTNKDPSVSVQSQDDCYCPMCPTWAVTTDKATQLNADWNTHCKAWADKEPCLPPPCPPPQGDAQCVDGFCAMPDDKQPPAP
jgi:hypothetical protein